MITVLLDDGEFTGLIKALRNCVKDVRIIGFVTTDFCAHKAMLDKHYVVQDPNGDEYYHFLEEICKKESVDYVFPILTGNLVYMAQIAEKLKKETGAVVITSKESVIDIANNKGNLFDAISSSEAGDCITKYKRVNTYGELKRAVSEFKSEGIECISKPTQGQNANGFMRFTDMDKYLENAMKGTTDKLFCMSLLDNTPDEKVLPGERIVMSYLPGTEWDVDVLSIEGQMIACTMRTNHEMFNGLSAASTSAYNETVLRYVTQIVSALGLSYLSCIGFKEDENGHPMLTEINPRVMGSIDFSGMAGNDLIDTLINHLLKENYKIPDKPTITKEGYSASLYYDLYPV